MDLHPDFPIVEGHYRMTTEWVIVLPSKFNRRIEDGDLVLWHPGFTAWIVVWGNDKNQSKEKRLEELKQDRSPQSFDAKEHLKGPTLYYTYRLQEQAEDKRVPALYCFAFSDTSHVQMSLYFDKESDVSVAESLCLNLKYEPRKP